MRSGRSGNTFCEVQGRYRAAEVAAVRCAFRFSVSGLPRIVTNAAGFALFVAMRLVRRNSPGPISAASVLGIAVGLGLLEGTASA